MRKQKQIVTLLLAAQLLALASCGGETVETQGSVQSDTSTPTVGTEETEPQPDLPDVTFGGAEYTVYRWSNADNVDLHTHFEYDAEELTGELLNDAIYNRNQVIEEQYDVTISVLGDWEPSARLKTDVTAGDTPYQVISDWPTRLANLSTQGMLRNFYDIPYVDTTKPWWDKNTVEAFTIAGKQYVITGDYVLYDKQRVLVFFFNHTLSDTLGIPDPYTTVNEGKWTMDLLNEYAELARQDLNGDGKMDPRDDQYGMISGSKTYMPYLLFGGGSRYSEAQPDGTFELVIDDEHTIDIISKLNLTFGTDNTHYHEDNKGVAVTEKFESGTGLFYHEVSQVTRLLDMEDDYGILPQPKYDENQENYLSCVQYEYSAAIGVPATIDGDELEMTGVLLEALSALSHTTTYPTFIEDILQSKNAPDKESADMLRLIYANLTYDLFGVFQFGSIDSLVYNNIYDKKGEGFTSTIASNKEKILAAYEKVYEAYTE